MSVDPFATPRPRLGPLDALTTLEHFALITYDVDPDRLAALLPAGYGFEPEVATLSDGRRRSFVSAVNFRDVDFRFAAAQFVRVSFEQTNYRAYVRRNGERAVWFFGTTLASRTAFLPRILWGMPWNRVDATLEATWDGERCLSYESRSTGKWAQAEIRLQGDGARVGRLDGWSDLDEGLSVLTHPLVGYFAHGRGGVGRYTVWHERLKLTTGHLEYGRFSAFEDRRLIVPGQQPHSVLLQPSTDFVVVLPPTRVRT
jgi:uncharacterized protein DUF2071